MLTYFTWFKKKTTKTAAALIYCSSCLAKSSQKRIQIIEIISLRDIFNARNVFESLELSHNKHIFFISVSKVERNKPDKKPVCVTFRSRIKRAFNKEKLSMLSQCDRFPSITEMIYEKRHVH